MGESGVESESSLRLLATIEHFESLFNVEKLKENPNKEVFFNYAWSLIGSQETSQIENGIRLLHNLRKESQFSETDCLYYEALGEFRLKQTQKARSHVVQLLQMTPNCRQANCLLDLIDDRLAWEEFSGIVSVSLVSVVLSAAIVVLWFRRHF